MIKSDRIIGKVKSKYWVSTHKFGVKIPTYGMCWTMSDDQYVKAEVTNVEESLDRDI